ncbi:MAG: hypothetical protein H0W50_07550 [Parachlamydiaceae bacterium]|nr:hypothetical protein [Parachlamydiaceae bacterium]
MHTSNQELFSLIVHTLMDMIRFKRVDKKKNLHNLDEAQQLPAVLANLMHNSAVKFPEEALPYIVGLNSEIDKDKSIFHYVPTKRYQMKFAKQLRVTVLQIIMLSKDRDKFLRILSIRNCASYLIDPKFGLSAENNEEKKAQNQKQTKKFAPYIETLSQTIVRLSKDPDEEIRNEAKLILDLVQSCSAI